jgi:hypothetical protein
MESQIKSIYGSDTERFVRDLSAKLAKTFTSENFSDDDARERLVRAAVLSLLN